jgi:hypothetical protein
LVNDVACPTGFDSSGPHFLLFSPTTDENKNTLMEALPVLSNDSESHELSFFLPQQISWAVLHAWHGFRQMALVTFNEIEAD